MTQQPLINDDELRRELLAKATRLSVTAQSALNELRNVLEELRGEGTRRKKDVDENGDPIWFYMVKVPLPADFRLTKSMTEYCTREPFHFTLGDVRAMFDDFVDYYRRTGAKWQHWGLVWKKWVRTTHERKTKPNNGTRYERAAVRT
jgi:hypothetical protein